MPLNSTIAYLRDITDEVRFIFGLFNLVVGLISNLSLIIIFTNLKVFQKTPSSFYLLMESYTNIGLLIFASSSHISAIIFSVDPTLVSLQWCKFRYGFNQLFGLCSLFTICFTTIDRYFSTHHRYTIRQLSTMQYACLFEIITLLLSLPHGILFYIYASIDQSSFGCSIYNVMMRKLNIANDDNTLKTTVAALLTALGYSLLYTNFSINFYLFLIVSVRFRCQVKHFIRKVLHDFCHVLRSPRHINLQNNQVVPHALVGNTLTGEFAKENTFQ
ncbi:unnamed protein product [Adineta ricciae]|uniref:G-protein coupled receptors family 1 profile domain-containing protein n=1 Tax=Adineta ricciae TaxID=249248 RepID=A0A815L8I7_ADIRI|nr:unnamed protein product [Adineta ricciae]